ncbi:MAG: DUF5719 family protein [Actinomycetaceae bacterium]|nr:DUF5719 family protein [Actinomycetaceae bacterium]
MTNTDKQHRQKWTAREAFRVTAIGVTATMGIAAMAIVGASGNSLDFGNDLLYSIEGSATLPDSTFHVVCTPSTTTDTNEDATIDGSVVVSTADGITIEDAFILDGKQTALDPSVTDGEITRYETDQPFAMTVRATTGAQLGAHAIVLADSDELNGYSVDSCGVASAEAWFALGATTVGQYAGITVANPAQAATEVRVEAWDSTGKIDETPSVTVSGRSTQTINLATYFPEEERLAVRLTASGPGAVFTFHTNSIAGLAPQGLSNVTMADHPSTTLVFAGFDTEVSDPVMRLANPADDSANVTIKSLTPEGEVDIEASELVIDPGAVFDVPLAGLGSEKTTVLVEADYPLVGSITGYTYGAENEDGVAIADRTTWMPTPAQNAIKVIAPRIDDASNVVAIANASDQVAELTIDDELYSIPARTTRVYPFDGDTFTAKSTTPVHATLVSVVERTTGTVRSATALSDPADTIPQITLRIIP